jgi:hypothetical protein
MRWISLLIKVFLSFILGEKVILVLTKQSDSLDWVVLPTSSRHGNLFAACNCCSSTESEEWYKLSRYHRHFQSRVNIIYFCSVECATRYKASALDIVYKDDDEEEGDTLNNSDVDDTT